MARRAKKRTKGIFGKLYIAYLVLILAAIAALFMYVRGILIDYEASQPQNYVITLLQHAGKSDKALGEYLANTSFSPTSVGDPLARSKKFYNTDAFSELEAKRNLKYSGGDIIAYDITADGEPFVLIALEKVSSKQELFIFTVDTYELKYAFLRNPESEKMQVPMKEDGTVSFKINLPKDFTLLFDGAEVDVKDLPDETIASFASFSNYRDVPKGVTAEFTLPFEPKITVKNNVGDEVEVELDYTAEDGYIYKAAADYGETEGDDKLQSKKNLALTAYKTWAMFMTNDVAGELNGLYNVLSTCHIMPGSDLEKKAKDWATNVDISFVSNHADFYFTDEKVGNYVRYNENFFSLDVSFTEVIYVYGSGNVSTKYNNRMFFIWNENQNQWCWVGSLDLHK